MFICCSNTMTTVYLYALALQIARGGNHMHLAAYLLVHTGNK